MPKGNRSNHRRTYALDEDLKELKARFFKFLDNDFRHLERKVTRQDAILYVLITMVAVLLAKSLGAF